jgi:hypothetical protein
MHASLDSLVPAFLVAMQIASSGVFAKNFANEHFVKNAFLLVMLYLLFRCENSNPSGNT